MSRIRCKMRDHADLNDRIGSTVCPFQHSIRWQCGPFTPYFGLSGKVSNPATTYSYFSDEPQTTRRIWGTRSIAGNPT